MNVHITCTPNFSEELLDQVLETLNQTPGIISFHKYQVKSQEHFNDYLTGFNDLQRLSNDQFFNICDVFRRQNNIPKEDYFVLISDKLHTRKWFSMFRNKSVFIIGSEWEVFIDGEHKYGIAHQVIENLFQMLIELKIEGERLDPLIHFDRPVGCINDFCGNKKDIEYKIFSARICKNCRERAFEKISNPLILDHIQLHLEKIRTGLLNSSTQIDNILPPLVIDSKGVIKVHNTEIELEPLNKAIYIFFAKELEGVPKKEMHKKYKFIDQIYKKFPSRRYSVKVIPKRFGYEIKRREDLTSEERINAGKLDFDHYVVSRNPKKDTFGKLVTDIKSKMQTTLGSTMFEKYIIKDIKNRYKIDLPKKSVKVGLDV